METRARCVQCVCSLGVWAVVIKTLACDSMSQFAEAFRDQFTEERLDFMNEMEDGIRNSVDERYKKGQGPSG